MRGLPVGSRAPLFTLPDLDGNYHSLRQFFRGTLLLLFIDPYLAACRRTLDELSTLVQEYKQNCPSVVAVSRGHLAVNQMRLRQYNDVIPILIQNHWEVAEKYMIFLVPVSYYIDQNGIIAKRVAVGIHAIRLAFIKKDD